MRVAKRRSATGGLDEGMAPLELHDVASSALYLNKQIVLSGRLAHLQLRGSVQHKFRFAWKRTWSDERNRPSPHIQHTCSSATAWLSPTNTARRTSRA